MTFDLSAIGLFVTGAVLFGFLVPGRFRAWALLVASLIAVYWLQPPLTIRHSDFILPSLTIGLGIAGWWVTRPAAVDGRNGLDTMDIRTLIVALIVVISMAMMRYAPGGWRLTPSRPPSPVITLVVIGVIGGTLYLVGRWANARNRRSIMNGGLIVLLLILFAVLKSQPLATAVSGWWREMTGRDPALASMADLNWIGFSFVAFRLLHTLRDRRTGLLPDLSLRDYLTYIIFFPAYTAGPIDRVERFAGDLRALPEMVGSDPSRYYDGGRRIALGLLKKFVLADSLALGLSLNKGLAEQATSLPGLWLLLYGYGLRLYLDFAGYSDIAIGIGRLFGIRLPENFQSPYLKRDLTAFWKSWHITLSDWARFYVFTPLSRYLLRRRKRPQAFLIVLAAQVATMVVIGLWHGFTASFLVWGLWHGLGLFIHKMWSDRTRSWYRVLGQRPKRLFAWRLLSWFLTFHYVTLGWVWFALPNLSLSGRTMLRLLGIGW